MLALTIQETKPEAEADPEPEPEPEPEPSPEPEPQPQPEPEPEPEPEPTITKLEKFGKVVVVEGSTLQDLELPQEIKVYYSNSDVEEKEVTWDTSELDFNQVGLQTITGEVEGINKTAQITIEITKLKVESLTEIEYSSIKIGDKFYGYDSGGENKLSYYMPSLYEAKLNNNSSVLFFQNDIDISSDIINDGNYITSSDLVKFILIASGTYKVISSENPFLDGNIKIPSYNGVYVDVKRINELYSDNKLSFRYEDVYESISNTYQEDFVSYDNKEYKVPTKQAEQIREDRRFGSNHIYFESQGIRHIATNSYSPYISINDLLEFFEIDKSVSYGQDGDNVYLEIK